MLGTFSGHCAHVQAKIRTMQLRVNPGDLVEKKDFVDAIVAGQEQRASGGSPIQQILRAPRLLAKPGATMPVRGVIWGS